MRSWTRRFLDNIAGRLQQPVCRRQRQRPDSARQTVSRRSPRNRVKAGIDFFGHRRVQGWRRCAVRRQSILCRRRNPIRHGGWLLMAVFNLHASYQINKTFPDLRARADNIFDKPLCDLWEPFFDITGAIPQSRQWRRGFSRTHVPSARHGRAPSTRGLRATF